MTDKGPATSLVKAALASGRIVQADADMRLAQIKSAASQQDVDLVAAHYDFAGTQADTFLGNVPSLGRSFSTRGMSLFRCADGKIDELWVAFNSLSMLQQLGAVPA